MHYIQDIPQKRLNYTWAQWCRLTYFRDFREGDGLLYDAFHDLSFYGVELQLLASDNSAVENLEEIAYEDAQFHDEIQKRWDADEYDMYSLKVLKETFAMAKPSLDNMIIIRSHFRSGANHYNQMHRYKDGYKLFGYDSNKPLGKGNSWVMDTRTLTLNTKEEFMAVIHDIMDDLNHWRNVEGTQIITTEEFFHDCIVNHDNEICNHNNQYENRCLYLALRLPKNL